MYFNQLAKEISMGQQTILRHMKTLEDIGLIESYAEKSNLGALIKNIIDLTLPLV